MALMSAMSELYVDGAFTDLTIRCGDKRWRVHCAVVCTRSAFFNRACRGGFLESSSQKVDLSEDDEDALDQMIYYLYHDDYLSNNASIGELEQKQDKEFACPRVPVMKELSLDYSQDPLFAQAAAQASFRQTTTHPLSPPAEAEISRELCPTAGLKIRSTGKDVGNTGVTGNAEQHQGPNSDYGIDNSHLLLHCRVYALAEKYDITALKTLARHKFEVAAACFYDSPEFADAVEEVYCSTIETDRGLRRVILQAFRNHPRLAYTKDVHAVIESTPALAFDLWRAERGMPV